MNRVIQLKVVDVLVWAVSLLFAFGLLINEAVADSGRFSASNAKWAAECGSCHIAYPPQLLPAASWRRIMAGLERHFGSDASVDAGSAAEIGAFLERNAGRGKRGRGEPLRITESRWFLREHDEVAAAAWKDARVRTAANCAACHAGAARGDFDDDAVRMPR
jgi:nitrate/TMAO reductase-like tetraheme cytochrome c subunit